MNTFLKFPFYAKASLLLIGLYVFISMLYIAQDIILPLIYATIMAILISPLVAYLVRKKMNRALAIASVLFIALLVLTGFIMLVSSQVSMFTDALPRLTEKFDELINQSVKWASGYFDISKYKIKTWVTEAETDIMDGSNAAIGSTLTSVGSLLVAALLTPVYIFMILFYQPHLLAFVHKVFGDSNNSRVTELLTATKTIIQSYIVGLFLEFAIIAVLNSIGLLVLGIEYAILLGVAGALLNVIPYLGGLIAVVLFMAIAFITKTPVHVLYVFAMYMIIQLVDNNYIVPKIVGSKVKLNALVSIIAVIAGAALWGIPGMFLSIPLTAIIKLIFDRIEPLKPLGFLLGDTMPPLVKLKLNLRDLTKKLPHISLRGKGV